MGVARVTWPTFLNFGTRPSITFQRMKLDTSHHHITSHHIRFFLCWIGHGKYYIRDDEWPKGPGRGQGHVSYFWSNGTDTCVPHNVFLVSSKFCCQNPFKKCKNSDIINTPKDIQVEIIVSFLLRSRPIELLTYQPWCLPVWRWQHCETWACPGLISWDCSLTLWRSRPTSRAPARERPRRWLRSDRLRRHIDA